jgi:hypothetical protein
MWLLTTLRSNAMPQQIKLDLAGVDAVHPGPTIPAEREQQLIALMGG